MKKYLSYIYVILGAACWGFMGLFNRMLASADATMGDRMVIRNTGALVLMTVVFLCVNRKVFRIDPRHLPVFLGSGALSIVGLSWVYFSCQMLCSLAVAAVLLYLAPSFVVLASAVLWKEKLTPRRVLSVLLALLGCALVSGIVGGDLTVSVKGLLFGIASGLCYASYTVFAHYGLRHYGSYTMIYWTFLVAGLTSLFWLDVPSLGNVLSQPKGVFGAVGLVVVATVLPYFFYTKGLEGVESGLASVIANVEPVVAALVGIFVFRETPTVWTVLGIGLVLMAAVILAKGDKNHAEERG